MRVVHQRRPVPASPKAITTTPSSRAHSARSSSVMPMVGVTEQRQEGKGVARTAGGTEWETRSLPAARQAVDRLATIPPAARRHAGSDAPDRSGCRTGTMLRKAAAKAPGEGDCLDARVHAQLSKQALRVAPDSIDRDVQLLGNCRAPLTCNHAGEDLSLSRGQFLEEVSCCSLEPLLLPHRGQDRTEHRSRDPTLS